MLPVLAGLADGFGVVAEPGLGVALSLTVGVTVGVVGFTVGGIDAGGLLLLGADGAVLADIVGVGVALPVAGALGDVHGEGDGDASDDPPDDPGELALPWKYEPEPATPDLPEPPFGPEC